ARHRSQMNLLIETLALYWSDRDDFFVGGNMFLYFTLEQASGRYFRGPDFFVVLGVPRKEHKSWLVWQEGKGPDVIIELLSASTAAIDKGEKKLVYQDNLRVPEYFWYHPFSSERAGFVLRDGVYEAILPDREDRLICKSLDLALVIWNGEYQGIEAPWLRWATLDGVLLPSGEELASRERRRADQERLRADQEQLRADEALRRVAELERQLEQQRREGFGGGG
ncbi:MAG: Uma2 family endonuclease, partial [Dehalococcoidia bacterium]